MLKQVFQVEIVPVELDKKEIRTIIRKFIREELEADYGDPFEGFDGLWKVKITEQQDGGVIADFKYVYNEDPYGDGKTQVQFQGSVRLDPKGKVLKKSMKMVQRQHRASGPRLFMQKQRKAREEGVGVQKDLTEWENSLKIGDLVEARFTGGKTFFREFHYIGKIIKINPKSIQVKPVELIGRKYKKPPYPFFWFKRRTIPKRINPKFAENYGLFPLDAEEG